ncbi:phage tail protein [Flavobacterium arcticum]|uniref:Phage tail protein n=1 Tax=Flavobacterium arcticum TaxID=1784713 RepID=A0A345HCT3_9FLAO|nr:tail fiber protein [Flavobacterium arcticum]AXG74393.1 phage tail protein [Flavobacterium arcticum]KAF2507491.1 phage tail protein [Flavobacterium arcticum]
MEEFIGTIQPFGFNFPPRGWLFCDGQILDIAQNTALFSLFGTTYGGDGRTTFGVPDLRGRSIVQPGSGPGLDTIMRGEVGGSEYVQVTPSQMPFHNHYLLQGQAIVDTTTTINTASNSASNEPDSGNNVFGSEGSFLNMYSEPPISDDHVGGVKSVSSISGTTTSIGTGNTIDIRNPFLGVYICVATVGIYPSRS